MVEGVQPFLIDQAVPFKSQYLAGFQAEKRDIEYEAIKNTSNKNYKIIRNHCYGTLLLVILRWQMFARIFL